VPATVIRLRFGMAACSLFTDRSSHTGQCPREVTTETTYIVLHERSPLTTLHTEHDYSLTAVLDSCTVGRRLQASAITKLST